MEIQHRYRSSPSRSGNISFCFLLDYKAQFPTINIFKCCITLQIGLMFYICIFWTSSSLFGAVYVFPFEKLYLVKDRKADMYRISVYYVCSTLCDMVAHVLYPTVFMTILYFMVGLRRTAECYFLTVAAILLVAITSQVSLQYYYSNSYDLPFFDMNQS